MADSNSVIQAGQTRLAQNTDASTQFLEFVSSGLQDLFNVAENQQSTGARIEDGRTIYTTPMQVQTEQLAAMEAQKRTQEFAHQIGINPDTAADLQMQLAAQIQDASRAALQQGQKIREMDQVGLFDDPLQYMVNYVMRPDEQNKLNAHLDVVEQNRTQLAAINQAVQQTAVTSNAISTKITEATMSDQMDAVAAELMNKKKTLLAGANMQAAGAIKDVYTLQGDRFNIMKDIWQVQRSDEQMAMQRESHALAKKQASLSLEKYQDEKDRIAYITDTINQAEVRQYGKAITTPNEVKFNWGNASEMSKKQQKLFDIGAGLKAGVEVSSGDSILERVRFLQTNPMRPGTSENTLKVAGLMQQSVAKAMEANKGAKPEVINEEAQKIFDKQFDNWRMRVDPKDQTNPFSLPPISVLARSSQLNSNPAFAYYRSTQTADKPADVNEFMHVVLPAIREKKVSLDAAVKAIVDIEASSRKTTEELNDLFFVSGKKLNGIQVPVQWDVPLGFKPTKLINPADPVLVKQTLVSMIMPQVNWSGRRMENDGFYPSKVYKPGVDDANPAKPIKDLGAK